MFISVKIQTSEISMIGIVSEQEYWQLRYLSPTQSPTSTDPLDKNICRDWSLVKNSCYLLIQIKQINTFLVL